MLKKLDIIKSFVLGNKFLVFDASLFMLGFVMVLTSIIKG